MSNIITKLIQYGVALPISAILGMLFYNAGLENCLILFIIWAVIFNLLIWIMGIILKGPQIEKPKKKSQEI